MSNHHYTARTTYRRHIRRRTLTVSLAVLLLAVITSADSFQLSTRTPYNRHRSALSASTVLAAPGLASLEKQQSKNICLEEQTKRFAWPFQNRTAVCTNEHLQAQKAKEAWAAKYCSVAGLREAFGGNRNVVWGDLDAGTTRRLYKALLPVALMDLYDTGLVDAEDLAPLAFRARLAAKLYARERSQIPARIFACLFDGFRQWRKYGSFDTSGMTYQQLWEKYAAVVADETEDDHDGVTEKICLTIIQRSCQSNEMIDKMVLSKAARPKDMDRLHKVSQQLEEDIRKLLQQPDPDKRQQIQTFKALRTVARAKRRIAALQRKLQ